jgi:hypothetical protein
MEVVLGDVLDEVSEVAEALLRGEEAEVGLGHGVGSEGQ